jgi:hypothetical protein
MSARVSFLANEVDEAVRKQPSKKLVAKTALANSGERKGVWTIADKKLLFVPVSTGVEAGSSIELIDGPAPGTRVVLSPASDFRNGQGVKDKQAVAD